MISLPLTTLTEIRIPQKRNRVITIAYIMKDKDPSSHRLNYQLNLSRLGREVRGLSILEVLFGTQGYSCSRIFAWRVLVERWTARMGMFLVRDILIACVGSVEMFLVEYIPMVCTG